MDQNSKPDKDRAQAEQLMGIFGDEWRLWFHKFFSSGERMKPRWPDAPRPLRKVCHFLLAQAAYRGAVSFSNVYDDAGRARAYAGLEFPGTYYLAYRDLPALIAQHVVGQCALDFGCGAGRSTRFLRNLGFDAVGIDISRSMIELAKKADPDGDYRLVNDGDYTSLASASFDLVLSAFAFDNIPDVGKRCHLLRCLRDLLDDAGHAVLLGSTPEIYQHEWASFTTRAFPENRAAKSGEPVRIVMKDVSDARPVVDIVWFHEDYLKLFAAAGLDLIAFHKPLGRADEPYDWVSETAIAPWIIYVVRKSREVPRLSPA